MPKKQKYYQQHQTTLLSKFDNARQSLPHCLTDYFQFIRDTKNASTALAYANDLFSLMQYLKETNPLLADIDVTEISLETFHDMKVVDYQEYVTWLKEKGNASATINRKLAAIASLYHYYIDVRELFTFNPISGVSKPKKPARMIKYLTDEEVADLFRYMDNLEHVYAQKNPHKLPYFQKTKLRDTAIFMTLLGTGIRVSELVGLDLYDVDFKQKKLFVTRKGSDEDFVYFNDYVEKALKNYMDIERDLYAQNAPDDQKMALFLSNRKKRLSVRSVETLVKKYTSEVVPLKDIYVHSLRATFATSTIQHTGGDTFTVSKALGHKTLNMVNAYAAASDERKKSASQVFNPEQY
jgi:site-specific recombinase XerD